MAYKNHEEAWGVLHDILKARMDDYIYIVNHTERFGGIISKEASTTLHELRKTVSLMESIASYIK